MPEPQARPETVVLLCDTDAERRIETGNWYHLNGRPFSKHEQSLIDEVTRDDFAEARCIDPEGC